MSIGTLFTALSYIVGLIVFCISAKDRQFSRRQIGYLALAGGAGGLIGARLTRIAMESQVYTQPSLLMDPHLGGRTIIGGILFGWVAVEICKMALGIKRSTGDSFALALPAGEAVGRIGCFLNGCCYGAPAALPWSVYQHDALRHPAQLYSFAAAISIFSFLWFMRTKVKRDGDLFRWYLLLYGSSRFCLEFFRERTGIYFGLSLAQWICIELVFMALITMYFAMLSSKRSEKEAHG